MGGVKYARSFILIFLIVFVVVVFCLLLLYLLFVVFCLIVVFIVVFIVVTFYCYVYCCFILFGCVYCCCICFYCCVYRCYIFCCRVYCCCILFVCVYCCCIFFVLLCLLLLRVCKCLCKDVSNLMIRGNTKKFDHFLAVKIKFSDVMLIKIEMFIAAADLSAVYHGSTYIYRCLRRATLMTILFWASKILRVM